MALGLFLLHFRQAVHTYLGVLLTRLRTPDIAHYNHFYIYWDSSYLWNLKDQKAD